MPAGTSLPKGQRPEMVIKTGSPMKEILHYYMPKITGSDALARLGVDPGRFLVVSTHREENVDSDKNFDDLLDSLNGIAAKYDMPVIVSTHPRTRKRLDGLSRKSFHEKIRFMKPLGFFDYVRLQTEARCVVSDSGTITEESSILNFPAVMIRQAHERPEGMDEGTVIMSGLMSRNVIKAIEVVTSQSEKAKRNFSLVRDYDTDNVSKKVLRIILSYTDYVNRTVWHR